ncbi:uncharacterized protein LOC141651185 [Silene latifolia]|uniref:uncharacterized protein LOC141651185 n=1 Tax=Silene latifolia TaxID=37657 RepID=UPI003D76E1ED
MGYVHERLGQLENMCNTLMRMAADGNFGGTPKVKPPTPHKYSRARDSKEVDNFLFDMEQLFRASALDETLKVTTASMYLIDDAKQWWRSKYAEIKAGSIVLESWDNFKRLFKEQFYPENTDFLARRKLKSLKHTGSIREYVKAYSTCMLEINDMTEKDRVFQFVDGLTEWAQREIMRQRPESLSAAMTVAERLVDYYSEREAAQKKGEFNTLKKNLSKMSVEPNPEGTDHEVDPGDDDEFNDQGEVARMGAVHMMCSMEKGTNISEAKSTELMYVEVKINEICTRAMIDTGASHNFFTPDEAKRLGMEINREGGRMKAVNSTAKPIQGVAKDVVIKMGEWSGKLDFTSVPRDDFNIFLGMDFLKRTPTFLAPHNCSLMMVGSNPCLVKAVGGDRKMKGPLLSVMQLNRGLQKGEPTYLCTVSMKEDTSAESEEPLIMRVLEDNKDLMPDSLPISLPPRRSVDHQIELLPGTRPPSRGPYCMAPPELAELRKQLDNLIRSGSIRPSKTSYGAEEYMQQYERLLHNTESEINV